MNQAVEEAYKLSIGQIQDVEKTLKNRILRHERKKGSHEKFAVNPLKKRHSLYNFLLEKVGLGRKYFNNIQMAIDALPNNPGGVVWVQDQFNIGSTSLKYKDQVILEGMKPWCDAWAATDQHQIIYTGSGFAIEPPDVTNWRHVGIRNLSIKGGGIHLGKVNFADLQNIQIVNASSSGLKTSVTAGNALNIRNVRIEGNNVTPIGIEVLSDWTWLNNVVIAKTTQTGIKVGSSSVKPYGIFCHNIHTFDVVTCALDLVKAWVFYAENWEDENTPTIAGGKTCCFKNELTNTDIMNALVNCWGSGPTCPTTIVDDITGVGKDNPTLSWQRPGWDPVNLKHGTVFNRILLDDQNASNPTWQLIFLAKTQPTAFMRNSYGGLDVYIHDGADKRAGTFFWYGFQPPKLADDPSTSGWGADQKGIMWFNSTSNVFKYWDGSAIQVVAKV